MSTNTQAIALNTTQVKEMFLYVGDKVIESKPLLTKLDSAIGDGDHGIGMSVGFEKAKENLQAKDFASINELFNAIGISMITSMGGASGVLFGTIFSGGVKNLETQAELDLPLFAKIFEASLEAVKTRGKANLGDKTMIDALEPAVIALKKSAESSHHLLEGLRYAEEEALKGVEQTKDYVAKFGRAKSLGERAIGHQDAGATTISIIFTSFREWVEESFKQ